MSCIDWHSVSFARSIGNVLWFTGTSYRSVKTTLDFCSLLGRLGTRCNFSPMQRVAVLKKCNASSCMCFVFYFLCFSWWYLLSIMEFFNKNNLIGLYAEERHLATGSTRIGCALGSALHGPLFWWSQWSLNLHLPYNLLRPLKPLKSHRICKVCLPNTRFQFWWTFSSVG